jgi:xanthosine utilization system XapX-like protein
MAAGVLMGVVYILSSLYHPADARVCLMLYIGHVALAARQRKQFEQWEKDW